MLARINIDPNGSFGWGLGLVQAGFSKRINNYNFYFGATKVVLGVRPLQVARHLQVVNSFFPA